MFDIYTVRNSSCGKVMFSQVCVKNSVHRGSCVCGEGRGGMHGEGGAGVVKGGMCIAKGGMCGKRGHVW